ncbi:MAG TPA: urease accessory protein UreD [Polyangiaceae bacterium]|nr:urease accessory protein UreD [Polyangiaceae bacterium]
MRLPVGALERTDTEPGQGAVAVARVGPRTVVERALARSPLRLLLPKNHGEAAWVFLVNLGGGLVDGDRIATRVDVGERAAVLVGTQASTKVYRSPQGCAQHLEVSVAPAAWAAVVPDPVVCFAGARYEQRTRVSLARDASVVLLDGYTCGRAARGERWRFDGYSARTTVMREGGRPIVDAVHLDPRHGSIEERMGKFEVVLTLLAVGPRFAPLREVMLTRRPAPSPDDDEVVAASPIGEDAALVRVGARRFEGASRALRPSFGELVRVLGDDPFARKW